VVHEQLKAALLAIPERSQRWLIDEVGRQWLVQRIGPNWYATRRGSVVVSGPLMGIVRAMTKETQT
jgi:hypothetical protein